MTLPSCRRRTLTLLWGLGCAVLVLALAAPSHAGRRRFEPGIDAPSPVGAFLDGILPVSTPSVTDWTVADAFPGIAIDQALVVVPNPSDDRLYVGTRAGAIVSHANDPLATSTEPFMDLQDRVAVVWDGGFLGLAFHPEFGTPGSAYEATFYAYYSTYCPVTPDGQDIDFGSCNPGYATDPTQGFFGTWLRLSRFQATWDAGAGVWRGDASSEEPMFSMQLHNSSHRGGGPVFANDGYLYVAIGDQFRFATAQDIAGNFEGGTIRIAVDIVDHGDGTWACPAGSHAPIRKLQDVTLNADDMTGRLYCIPDDNPWPGLGGENFGEYNSIGHRNPHRISVDSETGRIWSGEVGHSTREEINVILPGRNYQWPYMEGTVTGPRPRPPTVIGIEQPPVIDFDRQEARTIIGGYVYRGTRFPELVGRYLAGDYFRSNIWAIQLDVPSMTATKELLTTFTPGGLATFGQDNQGEVYMGSVFGALPLQQLEYLDEPILPVPPPQLSQLNAFSDLANLTPHAAAVPFLPVPFYSDGATKQRWIFLPNDGTHDQPEEKIGFFDSENWTFPTGTVLMKHIELPVDEADPLARVRLETRFQVLGVDGEWYFLTYRWRESESDADLLTDAATRDVTIEELGGGSHVQTWTFPSRSECKTCHTQRAGGALGPRTHQLNRALDYEATNRRANQLLTWSHLGMFDVQLSGADVQGLASAPDLDDPEASLRDRGRSWLDANCANCHRPGPGSPASFDARFTEPLEAQGLIWAPTNDDLGIPGAHLIHPGDPLKSVVYQRAAAVGDGTEMPPLAKAFADPEGLELLYAWILREDADLPLPGLQYAYYEIAGLSVLPDFGPLVPDEVGSVANFDISVRNRDDDFAFRFTGYVDVPSSGDWTFYTRSDDGSKLYIDDVEVVDNDGLHPPKTRSGTLNLAAGIHEIEVTLFERDGQEVLEVEWEGPATARGPIPLAALFQQIPNPTVNNEPTLDPFPWPDHAEGDAVFLSLSAHDADGDSLYFSAAGLPPGLSIDSATGQITGTIEAGAAGFHMPIVGVSDGPAVASRRFQWQVTPAP